MEGTTEVELVRLPVPIVAFQAETTIGDVLSRLPRVLTGVAMEALVLGNASSDATSGRARAARVPCPLTVLRNPVN